jgi:hypothetical protein
VDLLVLTHARGELGTQVDQRLLQGRRPMKQTTLVKENKQVNIRGKHNDEE